MSANRNPYGPGYQKRAAKAAVAAGCKGNVMGVLYCLMTKINWATGETPELAHTSLGEDMGGLHRDTIRGYIRELRAAGIIRYADYRGKGVVWSDNSGHSNRYQMALPVIDPVVNHHTPPGENTTPPRGKSPHHYISPYFQYGKKDPASRRGGQWPASSEGPRTPEEQQLFSQFLKGRSYGEAMDMLKDHRKRQAMAAE